MTMDARKQRVLQAIVALYGLEGVSCSIYIFTNELLLLLKTRYLCSENISSVKGKRIICFTHTHHPLPVIPPLPTWQDYAVGLHSCLYIRLCDKRAVAREP